MSLKKVLFSLGGRLLKPFVSIETAPTDLGSLHINTDRPIIYVLEKRGWTDLNVLINACNKLGLPSPLMKITSSKLRRWHSVYTIASRQPFKSWLLKKPRRSKMMANIIENAYESPELEIQFVPVSIFWGRPVSKQKHWLQVLFADSWAIAGRTRKLLTILFHGRKTLVTFSSPITLREHLGINDDIHSASESIHDALALRLQELRAATLGPDISHRRTLIRTLLSNPTVKKEIQNKIESDGISELKAALIARRYLYEIVADSTSITISLLQRGLTSFWNRCYSGIIVKGGEGLTELARTHTLVYVPCHRSHIDYLLLSYIVHSKALAIPHIAAGVNLKMPIIGPILRGGGAFFIRRTFRGNDLYATTLFEYVAMLVNLGMPIEYFIEGGRSRTGRLLKGKPGMLAMTVRAFLKYRKRPIAFIPVYIGYEKMLEGDSYLSELSGKAKKSETLFSSLRAIMKIRGEFGQVYTNFGRPIILDDVLDLTYASWKTREYDDEYRPLWLRDAVDSLSNRILTEINASVSLNPVNLIASILLTTSQQNMDEELLVEHIETFIAILKSPLYSENTSIISTDIKEQIATVESLGLIKRKGHELGDILYIEKSKFPLMPYYRNNVLHLFMLPAIITCCFNSLRSVDHERISKLVRFVYPYLKDEFYCRWDLDELDEAIDLTLTSMVEQGLLLYNEALEIYSQPSSNSTEYIQLETLGKIVAPVLELYYLVITMLSISREDDNTLDEATDKCFLMAQHMALIHEYSPSDFADAQHIRNFINALYDRGYLRTESDGTLIIDEIFLNADKDARILISPHMRSKILQLIKYKSKR